MGPVIGSVRVRIARPGRPWQYGVVVTAVGRCGAKVGNRPMPGIFFGSRHRRAKVLGSVEASGGRWHFDRTRMGLGDMSYAPSDQIGRPMAVGATVLFTHFLALVVGAASPPAIAAAEPKCADMIVSADELDEVLDQTLGSLRDLVEHRSVSIDRSSDSCYLRISLATSALSQFGGACRLEGCSAVLYRQKSIALRDFDVKDWAGLAGMGALAMRAIEDDRVSFAWADPRIPRVD